MAKASSIYPTSGSIGDVTFAQTQMGMVVRQKSSLDRDKFRKHPNLKQAREHAKGFGGASVAACPIYSALKNHYGKLLMMPYAHNEIIRRFKKAATRDQIVVDQYDFRLMIPALRGLDLSRERTTSALIKTTTVGSHHNPDTIAIQGFDKAAEALQTHGQTRIECRFVLKYVRLAEVQYDEIGRRWEPSGGKASCIALSPLTDWIPTDILPKEGLQLQLQHPHPAEPVLIFLFLEWRSVNEVTDEIKLLPKKAVVRLVAMQYSEALAAEIADYEARRQPTVKRGTEPTPSQWRTDPKAYLQAALKGFASAGGG
jgi:hypothetical protein